MTEMPFPTVAAAIRSTLESQGFTRLLGAEVVSVEPSVVTMAVNRRPELLQQNGLFHGGGIAYLIDNATTAAAATPIDPATPSVITSEKKNKPPAPPTGPRPTLPPQRVQARPT